MTQTATVGLAIIILVGIGLGSAQSFAQGSSQIQGKTFANNEKTDQLGLGLQVGNLSGVNLEYWLNNNRTINAAVLGERQNVAISLTHTWMFRDQFSGEFNRVVPFVGAGLIGANGPSSDVFRRSGNETFALSAQVPVGFEYLPHAYRFGVFIEASPSLEVTPTIFGYLTADLGARYYF